MVIFPKKYSPGRFFFFGQLYVINLQPAFRTVTYSIETIIIRADQENSLLPVQRMLFFRPDGSYFSRVSSKKLPNC